MFSFFIMFFNQCYELQTNVTNVLFYFFFLNSSNSSKSVYIQHKVHVAGAHEDVVDALQHVIQRLVVVRRSLQQVSVCLE